jgi:hypothetical protein
MAQSLLIGVMGSEKKYRTFFGDFSKHCAARHGDAVRCVALGFTRCAGDDDGSQALGHPYEAAASSGAPWPDVDVLLHKMSDVLALDAHGAGSAEEQQHAARCLRTLKAYVARRGTTLVVVDSLESVLPTTHRVSTCEVLQQTLLAQQLSLPAATSRISVMTPPTVVLADAADEDRFFSSDDGAFADGPWVTKAGVACGVDATHCMRVSLRGNGTHLRHDGTHSLTTDRPLYPRVAQPVIHGGEHVFKLYAVGPKVAVRVLANNMPAADSVRHGPWFSSHTKGYFPPVVNTRPLLPVDHHDDESPMLDAATRAALWTAINAVRQGFGLTLFGVDVVFETAGAATDEPQRRAFVIDVNYFPGFKDMGDIFDVVIEDLRRRVTQKCEQ